MGMRLTKCSVTSRINKSLFVQVCGRVSPGITRGRQVGTRCTSTGEVSRYLGGEDQGRDPQSGVRVVVLEIEDGV